MLVLLEAKERYLGLAWERISFISNYQLSHPHEHVFRSQVKFKSILLESEPSIDLNISKNGAFLKVEDDVLAWLNLNIVSSYWYFTAGPGRRIAPKFFSCLNYLLGYCGETCPDASCTFHDNKIATSVLSINHIVNLPSLSLIV